jgi:peptide chain release factor
MEKIIIQITSGRGPVECCRVVARVQERGTMFGAFGK